MKINFYCFLLETRVSGVKKGKPGSFGVSRIDEHREIGKCDWAVSIGNFFESLLVLVNKIVHH